MKIFYIVLVLLVAVVAVIFALQNSAAITISFFSWSVSGSLSLFLIVTLVIGFLLGTLIMASSVFKRGRLASGLKRKVAALEREKGCIEKSSAEEAAVAPVDEAAQNGETIPAEKKRG